MNKHKVFSCFILQLVGHCWRLSLAFDWHLGFYGTSFEFCSDFIRDLFEKRLCFSLQKVGFRFCRLR